MAFSQKNRIAVANHINARVPFKHASMSGKWVDSAEFSWASYGQLPQRNVAILRDLLETRDLYIIYSYTTPIAYAWDREIHMFETKYSMTTTHHQSIVKLTDHYATNK